MPLIIRLMITKRDLPLRRIGVHDIPHLVRLWHDDIEILHVGALAKFAELLEGVFVFLVLDAGIEIGLEFVGIELRGRDRSHVHGHALEVVDHFLTVMLREGRNQHRAEDDRDRDDHDGDFSAEGKRHFAVFHKNPHIRMTSVLKPE